MTPIPMLVVKPLPSGTAAYEAKRAEILQRVVAPIPKEYLLSQEIIDNAGKNVINIPATCGLLSARELEITTVKDAFALAEAIANKTYTAVEVATAFCKRAVIAHQLTSCLTDWFMDEAVSRAAELDKHLQETGKTVGPLHGVPISIKTHMPIKGRPSSTGLILTEKIDDKDCPLVAILRAAGAVFYCKTNQPQAIMHLESTSYYGRTLNPHNTGLTAGGSSGGEAALVAMRGSILGVGSDIGGSIRGPAAFCGIYGFKPTTLYVPVEGILDAYTPGALNLIGAMGPMAVSLRDMDLFMKVVIGAEPHLDSPVLMPIPWTGLETAGNGKKLRIGIMRSDGVIQPQPPITAALEWASSRLKDAGVEVRDFSPYQTARAIKNLRQVYWPCGVKDVRKALEDGGEPIQPLTEWIFKDAVPEEESSVHSVYDQKLERQAYWREFAKHWNEQQVDVILCPAYAGPAGEHDTAYYWNYTGLWNYLDCPGAVFPTPITVQGKEGTDDYSNGAGETEECKQTRLRWKEGDFDGAPVNLQIVARRYHDNQLFQALEYLKPILNLS